jgi:tetratricopeptide (TPR) repeat protein
MRQIQSVPGAAASYRDVALLAVALTLLLAGAPQASPAAEVSPGMEALEYAWRFASAIHADPKDRAKAQQVVVHDTAALGALDEALAWADQMEGWRQGLAWTDLAEQLARAGRKEEAEALLERAIQLAESISGWQALRIEAHVAEVLASMGQLERSSRISRELAAGDPRQYAARSIAAVAAGHAARGEIDEATEMLRGLDVETDLHPTWWRTLGWLNVAGELDASPAERRAALLAARHSAEGVPGWKRAQALVLIAERFRQTGERELANEALEEAGEVLGGSGLALPLGVPLTASVAREWARIGRKERARQLLARAEEAVPGSLLIERPLLYAEVASGYAVLGETRKARRLYDGALEAATSLVNARPRALAVVAICQVLGRNGSTLEEEVRGRLDALHEGLGDPW